jgi:hypothetical protein
VYADHVRIDLFQPQIAHLLIVRYLDIEQWYQTHIVRLVCCTVSECESV